MNIKNAKKQIKNAMLAYFAKDENGEYLIPVEKQRPVFLMGPPGIGKTAIMEQIASEMGVGLLNYSMTHHTRQSALGLPFISHKVYGGREYDISEYTMSEIIASVYDLMEETGVKEGILFLDEINCVSETLAPLMLQFLQYKVFGKHAVPEGWVVVTAGNPPEYNNSVRDFDVATWDRLKRVDVEPDFDVWKEYAYASEVHSAIITYLEIKKSDFYSVETTIDGKSFVTARGWEDLSRIITAYEKQGLAVDEDLISQYIQNKSISKEFATYYELYNKYKSDYKIEEILAGLCPEDIIDRAKRAKFDERLSLLGLILEAVGSDIKQVIKKEKLLMALISELKNFKNRAVGAKDSPAEIMDTLIENISKALAAGVKSESISKAEAAVKRELIRTLKRQRELVAGESKTATAFKSLKADYDKLLSEVKEKTKYTKERLTNAFVFLEKAFGEGQEMLIFVTELTANTESSQFISRHGCDEYFKHNKELLFFEREKELEAELEELGEI